jgi:hypothetical protein
VLITSCQSEVSSAAGSWPAPPRAIWIRALHARASTVIVRERLIGMRFTDPATRAAATHLGTLALGGAAAIQVRRSATLPLLPLQVQTVPQTPVRFRLPSTCDFCQAKGTIVPGTTVQGSTVLLTWVCRACGRDRPMLRDEQQIERRIGLPDRRSKTRKERRSK